MYVLPDGRHLNWDRTRTVMQVWTQEIVSHHIWNEVQGAVSCVLIDKVYGTRKCRDHYLKLAELMKDIPPF